MTNNESEASNVGTVEREVAQGREAEPRLQPRIYVASLSDYNAGRRHGAWLDADQTAEGLDEGIAAMLGSSPTPGAEVWAIHDYDGFAGIRLDEHEALEAVSRLGTGLARYGEAFASWVRLIGRDPEAWQHFEAAYLGNHESLSAYAESLLGSLGVTQELDRLVSDHLGERLKPYVQWDYEALARDLALQSDLMQQERADGSVDIFQGDFL